MIEVTFQPEIPQNTETGRLCSFAGCRLHLIHPLGFEINDKISGVPEWTIGKSLMFWNTGLGILSLLPE